MIFLQRLLFVLTLVVSGTGVAEGQKITFFRQFGTKELDFGINVAAHAGSIYIAGETWGAMPGQRLIGRADVFLTKYSTSGIRYWTRQFGSVLNDSPYGVAANATGVYVIGDTDATLDGLTQAGFLRKYSPQGDLLWTRQIGHQFDGWTAGGGIALQGSDVYVASTAADEWHTDFSKFDSTGDVQWTQRLERDDQAVAVAVVANANGPYLVGQNFIIKYDTNGKRLWARKVGPSGINDRDDVLHAALDSGGLYLAGYERNGPGFDDEDAFVQKFSIHDGTSLWKRQFGTTLPERASGIALGKNAVFVVGTTNGVFPGQTGDGSSIFVRKFDSKGGHIWTKQFDSHGISGIPFTFDYAGPATAAGGNIYVVGSADGYFPGQTLLGRYDAFLVRLTADAL